MLLLLLGVVAGLVPSTQLKAATLEAPATTPAATEEVQLAECPLTQWGEPIGDIITEQAVARESEPAPFMFELAPPKASSSSSEEKEEEESWLRENAWLVKERMVSHGCVVLKGWELVKTPEGFRRAYEALDLSPCLDPLHAVSARPMVDKKSAVYEAVNKESRANFFIGMHNEFVGTRSPRAAMFVCFRAADEGGEFLLADGRRVFRDVDADLLRRLYEKQIRYSVMELPFFGWVDALGPAKAPVAGVLKTVLEAAVNAKVDFDVSLQWLDRSKYQEAKTLQARAPSQPPVVRHPETKAPTWFCNVHSHSALLRKKREDVYGAEIFESGASRINKSDMYFGDDENLTEEDLLHLDEITTKHTVFLKMKPGDAVLVDNYQTMHGRNVFKGKRKHAVTWFE
ncbi:hypothetical protein CTAYLR_000668 [Chrysophaeum taylorii]|uniref:TauD/TfdA-like domain-containing protein n=1 Tax=Chrysophaeum taylorii TaxID=2483200 RepID=A0AAD7XJD7_9STRA|nr:hypothetical protein CTAYLR_000668 [Chrysophaeum taylorii]